MDYTGNSATLRRVIDFDDLSVSAGEGRGGGVSGRGTPIDGLYWEVPPERGTFFRL